MNWYAHLEVYKKQVTNKKKYGSHVFMGFRVVYSNYKGN